MAVVVSGDVGGGLFVRQVLTFEQPSPTIDKIEALYHINDKALQFTAHVYVTQDNEKGTAVIKGLVTDGSLQGTRVDGECQVIYPYGVINAQIGGLFDDTCFQGTLVVRPSSGN